MKDDVDLCPVFGQTQLVDGTVDRKPPFVDPQRPLVIAEEKREVELPGLDKVDGQAVGLGAGTQAGPEDPAYRCGEGGFTVCRMSNRQGGREASALLFFSGADKFVFVEDVPVRVCQFDAFVSEPLNDIIKSRVLKERVSKVLGACLVRNGGTLRTFSLSSPQ